MASKITRASILDCFITEEKLVFIVSQGQVGIALGIKAKNLEKLRNIGIFKASDLLKMAPEDLADKTGISPKLITKWLEDAAKLSINT